MSYFTQVYNWYYDIHPNRPRMEDYKRKNLVIKQINDMKQFKFRNKTIIPSNSGKEKDECIETKDNKTFQDLLSQQVKIEMLNKIKEFKSRNKKVDKITELKI